MTAKDRTPAQQVPTMVTSGAGIAGVDSPTDRFESATSVKIPVANPDVAGANCLLYGKGGAAIYQGKLHKKCGTYMKYVSCGNCVRCAKERDSYRELQRKLDFWRRQAVKRQEAY